MSRPSPAQWQRFLEREIPVTRALGVQVTRFDAAAVELSAPLAANRNDKGTGFAGSQYSLAVLSGWSLVMGLLREAGVAGQAVIASCELRYLRPVHADFRAICERPEADAVDAFLRGLSERGRARLALKVRLCCGDETALELDGRFAAVADSEMGSRLSPGT